MNKMNNAGRLLVLLLAALMALSLAACGAKGVGKMGSEPKSLEEAVAMHKELMAEETAIFSENTALWEKVFMEADKGMAMVEDGKTTASSCWIPSRVPKTSLRRASGGCSAAKRRRFAISKAR